MPACAPFGRRAHRDWDGDGTAGEGGQGDGARAGDVAGEGLDRGTLAVEGVIMWVILFQYLDYIKMVLYNGEERRVT